MKKYLVLFSFLVLVCSCKTNQKLFKSGQAQIELINGNTVYYNDGLSATIDELTDKDYTVFFLTRHAEKVKTGADPKLLPEGQQRAERLAHILEMVPLDLICSSPYKRTRATVAVCADNRKMGINEYNPRKKEQAAYFTNLIKEQQGSRVLVAGHSNTIPELLNFFVQESAYSNIDENDYDNFYIVAAKDGQAARVWAFKYH